MFSSRLGFLAMAACFAIGCGSSSYNSPSATPSAPTPTTGNGVAGSGMTISIPGGAEFLGANAFNPSPLTVASGTTVTWTNTDSVAHTSSSDGNGWDSGTLAPGRQFSFTFSTSGTFHYHCAIHPGMVGTVVVQ